MALLQPTFSQRNRFRVVDTVVCFIFSSCVQRKIYIRSAYVKIVSKFKRSIFTRMHDRLIFSIDHLALLESHYFTAPMQAISSYNIIFSLPHLPIISTGLSAKINLLAGMIGKEVKWVSRTF